jgi:pyruvate dehydrogenase E2 component (dihydrolipoyllysine-residue acetyltransferase)
MVTEVIMPKLGQTMEEGTIVEWIKKEGDPVNRGDTLFTVESDKAVLEVESSAKGFLRKILVPVGEKVPVLTVIALITRTADEAIEGEPALPTYAVSPALDVSKPTPEPTTLAPAPLHPATGRLFASPRARKTAREKGVDLAQVTGSGPGGRIVERDVLRLHDVLAARTKATPLAAKAAEALGVDLAAVGGTGVSGRIMKADVEAAVPPPVAEAIPTAWPIPAPAAAPMAGTPESVPVTGLRRIIAERMAASHHTTARVTLVTETDATAFVEAREQIKTAVEAEWGFAPGYNDLLGVIVARALREFPYMNARLSPDPQSGTGGQVIERLPFVNLGMAVDTDRGLLVPVIRNADQQGLRAFGTEFRALVERARAGKALPDDLSGGTFTITNLGMYDVDAFTPIINLPEAAILGVGRIQPKPVVRDVASGQIVVRQMWTLSLAFDHRLVDGAPAARFLQRIKQLIENPYLLLV